MWKSCGLRFLLINSCIITWKEKNKGVNSLEICAGASGQALGSEEADFHHVALVETEHSACQTLKKSSIYHIHTFMKEFMKWVWIPIYVGVLLSNIVPISWVKYSFWLLGILFIVRAIYIGVKDSKAPLVNKNNARLRVYFAIFTLFALTIAFIRTKFYSYPKAKAKMESYVKSHNNS